MRERKALLPPPCSLVFSPYALAKLHHQDIQVALGGQEVNSTAYCLYWTLLDVGKSVRI